MQYGTQNIQSMQEHFPVSPRGFTWCGFLLSCVNLLFVSSFSVQADDRIRIEKRENSMFEYPAAMRIIKDFYRDTPHPTVGNQEKGKWLYLCLLSVFLCLTFSHDESSAGL